jgi:hypothetical protein
MVSIVYVTKYGMGGSAFSKWVISILFCLTLFLLNGAALAQVSVRSPAAPAEKDYHLKLSVMCERIKGSTPINRTIVFSASLGRAFCYTVFDPVLKEAHISHVWYYRDRVVSRKKLILRPNYWETYSDYKIGNKVRGPWRVEILDAQGGIIDVLRFSVTD